MPSVDAALKPLFPALVALLSPLWGLRGAADAVTVAAGAATVVLAGLLAARLTRSRVAGLTASAAALLSPALAYWSGFAGPDPPLPRSRSPPRCRCWRAGRPAGALGGAVRVPPAPSGCSSPRPRARGPDRARQPSRGTPALLAARSRSRGARRAPSAARRAVGRSAARGRGGARGRDRSISARGGRVPGPAAPRSASPASSPPASSPRCPATRPRSRALARTTGRCSCLPVAGLLRACRDRLAARAAPAPRRGDGPRRDVPVPQRRLERYLAQVLPLALRVRRIRGCPRAGGGPLAPRRRVGRPWPRPPSRCWRCSRPRRSHARPIRSPRSRRALARLPAGPARQSPPPTRTATCSPIGRSGARARCARAHPARRRAARLRPGLTARGTVIARLRAPAGFERPDGTLDMRPALLVRGVVVRTG